jgi:3-keto steroid reductase
LQDFSKPQDDEVSSKPEELTLIMACRSLKRAESARAALFQALDAYIESLKASPDDYVHARNFRETVVIKIHQLDLAIMNSVFQFSEEILSQ